MQTIRERDAFTLIELIVVIAIIFILAGILVPAVGSGIQSGKKASCKSLLRNYQVASTLYAADHDGWMVDSYNHLNPTNGICMYMGGNTMPQQISRCPGDQRTEALGRLGSFPQYGNLKVSIGCNENVMSCSARATSVGPKPFWVRQSTFGGVEAAKLMTWADWQNNPASNAATYAVVKPTATGMGTLCFRHNGVCNAAFLDGHVGEMKPTIAVINDGHDLANGNWPFTGSMAQLYKCYYPFSTGASPGSVGTCRGIFPNIVLQ